MASPLVLVLLVALVGFLAKATWGIYTKSRLSASRLDQAQGELSRLEDRQTDLSAKIADLSTEQGIETEIRTKYHAVKDGESVAVIVDPPQAAAAVQASTTVNIGWWQSLLRFFGL